MIGNIPISIKRDEKESTLSIAALTGLILILSGALTFAVASVGFMLRSPVSVVTFPAAFLLSIFISGIISGGFRSRRLWLATLCSALIICLSIAVGILAIDYSWDGLAYHQETIALLCNGWNPFYEAFPSGADGPFTSIWALHYAKGVEIVEAAIVSFTGKIESGKALNIFMTIGVGCIVYDFIRCRFPEWKRFRPTVIALAAIANPVIWEQILTYYIDFYKYLYLIIFLMGAVGMASEFRLRRIYSAVLIAVSVVMSVATKFNFFFEAGLWGLAALIWTLLTSQRTLFRRLLTVGLISFAIAILLNYHPYFTNYLSAGHPLYPLMGENAVDIMSGNTTPMFQGYNRVVNFFRSLLIPSFNIDCDQRNFGFSPFMPLILLLSLIAYFLLRRRLPASIWYISGLCLLSCFIFDQTWWPRYICQLWLVPAIILPYALEYSRSRLIGGVCAGLMILAGVYVFSWSCKHEFVMGSYSRAMLREAAKEKIEVVAPVGVQFRRQLEEAGVKYTVIDHIPDPDELQGRRMLFFFQKIPPVLILSESQAEAIRLDLEGKHLNYIRHEYDRENDKLD